MSTIGRGLVTTPRCTLLSWGKMLPPVGKYSTEHTGMRKETKQEDDNEPYGRAHDLLTRDNYSADAVASSLVLALKKRRQRTFAPSAGSQDKNQWPSKF